MRIGPSPNMIKREGAERRIDVGFNVQGRDLGVVSVGAAYSKSQDS